MENRNKTKYFPFFIDITGKKMFLAGAGKIALRRASALLRFGAELTVVAPEIREEFYELQKRYGEKHLQIVQQVCTPELLKGYELVLAATDSRPTDRMIWEICKKNHIWVNVASDQTLCDFHFPALIETDEIVTGVTSNSGNHRKVREVSARIREVLDAENKNIDLTVDGGKK